MTLRYMYILVFIPVHCTLSAHDLFQLQCMCVYGVLWVWVCHVMVGSGGHHVMIGYVGGGVMMMWGR